MDSCATKAWTPTLSLTTNNGTRKPTYRYNTTGFTVGGPIYIPKHFNVEKNKLFFFASEEYQQQYIGTNTNNKTTPTTAQRLGIFHRRRTAAECRL